MKKCKFIIGKRQIMISTLLVILAAAAYLNWLASSDQSITVMDNVSNIKKTENFATSADDNLDIDDIDSNYGDAQLVSNQSTDDYFNRSKIQKSASAAEYSEQLNKIMNSTEISEEKRNEAANQAMILNQMQQHEHNIEDQVKALGYEDCLAHVSNKKDINSNVDNTPTEEQKLNDQNENNISVNVTVKAKNMTTAQAAKIKDIIVNETHAKPFRIVVTPVDSE